MSHIPASAMPHAGTTTTTEETSQASGLTAAFSQIGDTVREYPKTAAAVGAAVVVGAGLVAAKAIRGRSSAGNGKGSSKSSRKSSH